MSPCPPPPPPTLAEAQAEILAVRIHELYARAVELLAAGPAPPLDLHPAMQPCRAANDVNVFPDTGNRGWAESPEWHRRAMLDTARALLRGDSL